MTPSEMKNQADALQNANKLFDSGLLLPGAYYKRILTICYAFAIDHDMRWVIDLMNAIPLVYFKSEHKEQCQVDHEFARQVEIVKQQMIVYGVIVSDGDLAPTQPAARRPRN